MQRREHSMSLLQHPLRALDQVQWYLDSRDEEKFPGALLLSAGNLARQVLEQVLFILAFYSRMPENKFLKSSNELRTAGTILKALHETDPHTDRRYLELARQRGSRIRKFARYPRSLNRWRRLLNEPSHFSNPAVGRKTREKHIRDFVRTFRDMFEEVDAYLITAAINELRTDRFIRAVLGSEPANTPGVECTAVVTPDLIELEHGKLSFKTPLVPIVIVPDSQDVPYRWKKRVVLVQHSSGMNLRCRMITSSGSPLDLTSVDSVLSTFAADPKDWQRLVRRLRKLGVDVQIINRPSNERPNNKAMPVAVKGVLP